MSNFQMILKKCLPDMIHVIVKNSFKKPKIKTKSSQFMSLKIYTKKTIKISKISIHK